MKAKAYFFSALVALLGMFALVATPVRAEGVDDRIQALEEELGRLKTEQEQQKQEQMELKKEATAAAAAMPAFSYRPGRGMNIVAADKSWAFNLSSQFHLRLYNHLDGNDSDGATTGKLFGRRMTLFPTFCWANCFYQFDLWIDMDQNNIPLELQRAQLEFDFSQMNPFFPSLRVGLDSAARKGHAVSSSSSARWERNALNDGDNSSITGSHQGIGLIWSALPLGVSTFDLETHLVTGRLGAGDSATTNSDLVSFIGYTGGRPFARVKNKWLSGLELRFEAQIEPIDTRAGVAAATGGAGSTLYRRLRLRTDERLGRFTVFDTGNNAIGGDLHYFLQPALLYRVGPYAFNAVLPMSRWEGKDDGFAGVKGDGIQLANELYLFSPKGAFTGSATTPGSVLLGFAFSRYDLECGSGADCAPGAGAFSRVTLLHRETNLWYTVRAGLRVGVQWNWWDSSNTPLSVQRATGCVSNRANATNVGKSCDWHTLNATVAFNW